jgi:hypothetical protein
MSETPASPGTGLLRLPDGYFVLVRVKNIMLSFSSQMFLDSAMCSLSVSCMVRGFPWTELKARLGGSMSLLL